MIDLLVINSAVLYTLDKDHLNTNFLIYINTFWLVSSLFIGFYKVYRFTKTYRIFTLLLTQFIVFLLGYFAYFGLFKEGYVVGNQTNILLSIILGITVFKFTSFYALKIYRLQRKNYRRVVVLGKDYNSQKVITFFKDKKNLGYRYLGYFSDVRAKNKEYLGIIKDSTSFILDNSVDEIYCTLSQLSKEEVVKFTEFADKNNKVIKLIPNGGKIHNKEIERQVYDNSILILNVKKMPFDISLNHFAKRTFDVSFSLFICIFILSWLTPIIWLFIKLESRGGALFKQEREGINGNRFICYKFRSMKLNAISNTIHTTKDDVRITKMGSFLRKTSLDELPQFFNVLRGDMSVVGPRPHMETFSLEYQKEVTNYMKRRSVKPGITGLAQISGYRGEVRKTLDIKNRVRLDIFYIENWSFLLDMKIIIKTVLIVFTGDKKAY